MCDVVTALKIGTAIVSYRNQRAIAKSQERANEQTRINSDQAYLNDIAKIDAEYVLASREKKAEDFKTKQESAKKQAQALNMNAGNGVKIIQDIAGTYDMQFLDVARDYETDVIKLMSQEREAYAAQQRRYNSIKPVAMPSQTGLMLQVATIGAEGYQTYKNNQKPDTGEVVAP
ncbi:hypothetical protein HTVC168P_gp36 [Pelagibacter phage HTVC168P]|nr:hypothetical protein HTVC168P_gp36 [Pelagibacter phage HTVC168P]